MGRKSGRPGKPGAGEQGLTGRSGPVPVNTGPILHQDDDFLYEELILVGGAACDWLTLTTFSEREYLVMQSYTLAADSLRRMPVEEARRMQYRGIAGDGWFVGEGRQDGARHFMMQASGARASDVLCFALQNHANLEEVKCTRIDIQCTSTVGWVGDMPAIAESLRALGSGAFGGRGPRPKITYYSSENGRDTLYIGSRRSPRFWRCYNKEVSGELRTRLELEAKSWMASVFWEALCSHGTFHVKQLYAREAGALPLVLKEALEEVGLDGDSAGRTVKPVADTTEIVNTQRWLMECVLPAFERIVHSEVGREVRAAYGRALGFDRRDEEW